MKNTSKMPLIAAAVLLVVFVFAGTRFFATRANDARKEGLTVLLHALDLYRQDNDLVGQRLPEMGNTTMGISSAEGDFDLCSKVVPTYIASFPVDPNEKSTYFKSCEDYISGYTIFQDANNKIILQAPYAQNGKDVKLMEGEES